MAYFLLQLCLSGNNRSSSWRWFSGSGRTLMQQVTRLAMYSRQLPSSPWKMRLPYCSTCIQTEKHLKSENNGSEWICLHVNPCLTTIYQVDVNFIYYKPHKIKALIWLSSFFKVVNSVQPAGGAEAVRKWWELLIPIPSIPFHLHLLLPHFYWHRLLTCSLFSNISSC